MRKIEETIEEFELLVKELDDLLECRVEELLTEMSETFLCKIPEEEPLTAEEFVFQSDQVGAEAAQNLGR